MSSRDRLSNRQIATLRHLAICTGNGGQVTLTREQREAAQPLWRRGLVEIWYRQAVDGNPSLQGPFFRPTIVGRHVTAAVLAGRPREAAAAEVPQPIADGGTA